MIAVATVMVLGLGGCPQGPEASESGSDGPPEETAEPPPAVPVSVCEQLDSADGADDTAGAGAGAACPEVTGHAIRVEWYPDVVVKRQSRSSVFFNAKNLLREQVEVEYEATARMVGSHDSFSFRIAQPRRTFDPIGGGLTQLDLQLGVALNVLTEGDVEVSVAARLLRPVETPMVEMSRVVVTTKLDDDGYIYDIDYVEW